MDYKNPKVGKSFKIPIGRRLSDFTYDWDREVWVDNKTGAIVLDNKLVEIQFPEEELE